MWIGLAIGWVVGSISLYVCMYVTAREAPHDECVECRLHDCSDCPHIVASAREAMKRAA